MLTFSTPWLPAARRRLRPPTACPLSARTSPVANAAPSAAAAPSTAPRDAAVPDTTPNADSTTPNTTPQQHKARTNPAATGRRKRPAIPPLPPMSPYPLDEQRCGFAALLGPSNSGKSTLLNALMGQKVAIVTPKVQTTRCRVAGIATYHATQVVYLDTPGIFEPSGRLGRAMVKSAWTSGGNGDTMSVILDAAEMFYGGRREGKGGLAVSEAVKEVISGVVKLRERGFGGEVCVCANKMDAVPEKEREALLEAVRSVVERIGLKAQLVFGISAKEGDGVDEFVEWVKEHMPAGPWLYPEDDLTDMPARLLAAEVVREQAFLALRQELPYEIAVETTSYAERDDGSVRVTLDVLVARDSQKRIVTGTGGAVVKRIGMRAREELAKILGVTVHLMLRVKVKGKWKEEKSMYDQWGLDYHA